MLGTRNSRATTYSDLNRQHRQRSGSQANLSEQTDRRQTYGALRRSSSSSNLRTPRRTNHLSRSPGNRTPSTINGPISNSEQNRRQAADNTAKVMELIQSSRTLSNLMCLGSGGLKSMTLKNFIDIMSFCMMKIAGKIFINKINVNSHEDAILTFLETLKYPYVVNPTCLKTPSQYNCFPDAVAILAFLSDIVRDIRKYAGPTEMPLIHCDELITDKFTETFAAEMLRNYNNIYLLTSKSKDDEARDLINDEVHERLVNGLIAIKMKKEDITIEKIEAKAEELRLSSEKLEQKLVATDCDKYFAGIVEQYAEKKLEYQKIVEELTEKRKYLKMIKLTYDTKAQKLASKQVEIQKLTYQIQQQKYSVIDIKQLLAKETSIKNSIAMIQAETDAIKIDAANAQVKFARAQKLKLDVIKKFNDFTFQITQKLMQIHSYANLNINDITIDPTASSETILTICSRVHHLKENCAIVKKEHLNKIEQNKARLEELKVYSNRLSQKCTEKMAKRDADERKQNKLTEMYAMYEHDGSLKVAKLQRDIAHQIALKAKMDEDLVNLEKEAEKLAAKNVEIFNEGERKAYEQIREKQTICDEMTKLNDFVDQWTN